MTQETIDRLVADVKQDEDKYRSCLIEDIIRVKRTLWGFGYLQHDEFLTAETAVELFDRLYDMDIISLEIVLTAYSKIATNHVNNKIKAQ